MNVRSWRLASIVVGAGAAVLLPSGGSSQERPAEPEEIVVVGIRSPIIVNGQLRRCPRRPGDPKDSLDLSDVPYGAQTMIVHDTATGQLVLGRDNDPIGGADWQRAGTAIKDYVFRAPSDGNPLCIGSRAKSPRGFGQLRQIVDAIPYRGRGVRFSGYIASQRGANVRTWLAAGIKRRGVIAGNGTRTARIRDRSGWIRFALEIPYVPENAWSLSYGFLLDGPGDVWVYDPRLEPLPARGRDRRLRASIR
jgi:hypothetical protein